MLESRLVRLMPLVVIALFCVPLARASKAARVPERVGEAFAFTTWGGRIVLPAHFDQVTPYRNERAAVMRNGKWGFIDLDGSWIGQPKYDWVHPQHFDEGPALVSVSGLYGYIDRDGHEVVALGLEQGSPFVGGYACIYEPQAMAFGLIDAEGLPVTGFRFDECDPAVHSDRARVRQDRLWGYVDAEGELALSVRYDRAERFSEGLALVEEGGLRAYINPEGERVIPANGLDAGSFSGGRAWVERERGQVGFIDATGQSVGPARWRAAQDFHEGYAWVQDPSTGRWSAIDRSGQTVLPPRYDDPSPFDQGVARVRVAGRYGLIDPEGQPVVPLRYAAMGELSEGLVSVATEPGGPYGVVDLNGRTVIEQRYEHIGTFRNGLAPATRCRWEKSNPLGGDRQRCELVFVDRDGKERSRRAP